MTYDSLPIEDARHASLVKMEAAMVLYRELGDRPFPESLWNFLIDLLGPGPLMVRYGRFGRASFCVVVCPGLRNRISYVVPALYDPVMGPSYEVRVCTFRISVSVNFRYWFIWRTIESLEEWIRVNRRGYRASWWSEQDRLRSRVVEVFQRACRLGRWELFWDVPDVGIV